MRTSTEIKNEIAQVAKRGEDLNRIQNEGGEGFDNLDFARIEELQSELDDANFAENWSAEQTAEKRALWNAEVRSAQAAGRFNHLTEGKIESKLGFRIESLKEAVAFHA